MVMEVIEYLNLNIWIGDWILLAVYYIMYVYMVHKVKLTKFTILQWINLLNLPAPDRAQLYLIK